jgi:hypothetical protein
MQGWTHMPCLAAPAQCVCTCAAACMHACAAAYAGTRRPPAAHVLLCCTMQCSRDCAGHTAFCVWQCLCWVTTVCVLYTGQQTIAHVLPGVLLCHRDIIPCVKQATAS